MQPEATITLSRGDPLDPCWLWVGRIDTEGYARQGASFVDSLICEAVTGQRLDEPTRRIRIRRLCHARAASCADGRTCPHRRCVNPAHLDVSVVRPRPFRKRKPRTHCREGHELTPENIYCHPNGHRRCRTCRRKTNA